MARARKVERRAAVLLARRGYVESERCVYCGAPLPTVPVDCVMRDWTWVHAGTRFFPVCDARCAERAEGYLARDRARKRLLYLVLMLAAVIILVAALMELSGAMLYLATLIAGLGFILFPYPITSFETFLGCPMRATLRICRVLGVALCAAAAVLFLLT